jgi:transaldolase/glucose-6-phosphate isomerase
VQIDIADIHDLGGELFRWEFATAVAGSVMGVNVFNQPDVEASKRVARELIAAFDRNERPPHPEPVLHDGCLRLFTAAANAAEFRNRGDIPTAVGLLGAHLGQLRSGYYFTVLAYLSRLDVSLHSRLQQLRHAVRERYRVATCLGYGPRYLHSTGQAHKGGPDTGVFLMITADHNGDLAIPGHRAGFGEVEAAQAEGDFRVLAGRGRRVLRVHLSGNPARGLLTLQKYIMAALAA